MYWAMIRLPHKTLGLGGKYRPALRQIIQPRAEKGAQRIWIGIRKAAQIKAGFTRAVFAQIL
jgi:hypothetical protein